MRFTRRRRSFRRVTRRVGYGRRRSRRVQRIGYRM